jgi:hypothetical protein
MPNSENDKLQKEVLTRQINDQKAADASNARIEATRNKPLPGSMGNDPSTKSDAMQD